MPLSPHTIKQHKSAKRGKVRVGRGNSSGKGTYSSRGLKGQRSRSGGKGGTQRRGFRQSLQKIPKLRGFKSATPKKELVTLATLERVCAVGDMVSPRFLKQKSAVDHPLKGVKIVATGTLTKKIHVQGCVASKTAAAAIEKAGGTISF
jgi:large subunit ribosomal protein L15